MNSSNTTIPTNAVLPLDPVPAPDPTEPPTNIAILISKLNSVSPSGYGFLNKIITQPPEFSSSLGSFCVCKIREKEQEQ